MLGADVNVRSPSGLVDLDSRMRRRRDSNEEKREERGWREGAMRERGESQESLHTLPF